MARNMADERAIDTSRSNALGRIAAGHTPIELAQRIAEKRAREDRSGEQAGAWRRETFTLPRHEARAKAHECFDAFPKAAYMTEIEFWREMSDGLIEFTIRRLPTAE